MTIDIQKLIDAGLDAKTFDEVVNSRDKDGITILEVTSRRGTVYKTIAGMISSFPWPPATPKSSISFIFDDGLPKHYSEVAPYFKSLNIPAGFAIHTASIDAAGRLDSSQIIEMSKDGHEMICHTHNHTTFSSGLNIEIARAEILQSLDIFNSMGIDISGFVGAQSVVDNKFINLLRANYEYTFTRPADKTNVMRDENPYKLNRAALESMNNADIDLIINSAKADGGSVVFYAHDYTNNIKSKVEHAISYATTKGVDIVSPSMSASLCSKGIGKGKRHLIKGDVISTSRDFNSSNGTMLVDANKDIRETASTLSTVVKQISSTNFKVGQLVTFSSELRKISGTIGPNTTMIIYFKSGSTVISTQEIDIGQIDTKYYRYSVSCRVPSGSDSVTYGFLCDHAGSSEILMRDPILRYGNSVLAIVKQDNSPVSFKIDVDTNKVIPASTNTIVGLVNTTNAIFSVSNDSVFFSQEGHYLVNIMLASSNDISANLGGYVKAVIDGVSIYGSFVTNEYFGGGFLTFSIKAYEGMSFSIYLKSMGGVFNVGSNSRLNITKTK